MAAIHDRAREERWKQKGGARRHFRLTRKADDALHQLANAYDCNIRDVIEGLLLGTIDPNGPRTTAARKLAALNRMANQERLSPDEAAYLREVTA